MIWRRSGSTHVRIIIIFFIESRVYLLNVRAEATRWREDRRRTQLALTVYVSVHRATSAHLKCEPTSSDGVAHIAFTEET